MRLLMALVDAAAPFARVLQAEVMRDGRGGADAGGRGGADAVEDHVWVNVSW